MCLSSNFPWFLWNFSFQANLAEKSISSIFETISGFCSSFGMDYNSNFQNPWYFFSITISWSRGDKRNLELRAWKNQIFKVIRFIPNFRGMLSMTSIDIMWPYFLKKYPTKWFIHDSSGSHAFPHVLRLVDTSSS